MKFLFFSCLFFALSVTVLASDVEEPLSSGARISILTSSPHDGAVYALYGHTAIRVLDTEKRIDLVFNYGIFDFSKPNFIYRFAKGETDYILSAYNFKHYIAEYRERGSEVTEQALNLLPEEREALWQALALNAAPENRVYRYNFFFDNCATRPIAMIEKSVNGTIYFQGVEGQETFRHAINYLTREHEWQTFGCDLVLGAPTDRIMTQKERLFLPENLKEYISKSVIVRGDISYPAVAETVILAAQQPKAEQKQFLTSPFFCFTVLFIIIFFLTVAEWRQGKYFRFIDCMLFFTAGMAGCILFFLSFFSVHPCMFPNINLLWLHPLHLAGATFFSLKKFKKPVFWYHFINFAAIFAMCMAWFFIPQHFNIAFIPLIAMLLLRSGRALLRKKLLTE